MNRLFYGDNLPVLREHVTSESVDLVYLDPPFNSNRSYSVIFGSKVSDDANAQIQAFDDTWHWTPETERLYRDILVTSPQAVADAMQAFRTLVGESDAMAYLVMMAPRLVELHRALKSTGSLVLHCDPTMSHYLKVLLDSIFGPENLRNEIIWQRTGAKGYQTRRLASNHDVLLFYGKSDQALWNNEAAFRPYREEDLDDKTREKYAARDADGRRYQLTSLVGPNDPRPNLTYEFLGVTRRWRWSKELDRPGDDGGSEATERTSLSCLHHASTPTSCVSERFVWFSMRSKTTPAPSAESSAGSASNSESTPKRCAAGSVSARSMPATGPAPPQQRPNAFTSWRRKSASCGGRTRS